MSGAPIRWSSDAAKIEALGETKVKNLGSFVGKNMTPASLAQRYMHWTGRWSQRFLHVPKVGMKPFWIMAVAVMAQQYVIRYNFSPILKKHQWRKYH